MRKSDYQELESLISHEVQAACPFVPFSGSEAISSICPRILYIGKATFGWDGSSFEDAQDVASRFVMGEVARGQYRSAFWDFIIDVVPRVHRACGLAAEDAAEWALDRIRWTNLMKVGSAEGNPYGGLYGKQRLICHRILRDELQEFRPTCVVMVTGGDYEADVYEVFGREWDEHTLRLPGNNLWVKDLPDEFSKGRVYWTRHPQGWRRDHREAAKELISQDHARFTSDIRF